MAGKGKAFMRLAEGISCLWGGQHVCSSALPGNGEAVVGLAAYPASAGEEWPSLVKELGSGGSAHLQRCKPVLMVESSDASQQRRLL